MNTESKYSNGEITIVWRPGLCQHSGVCVHGLPVVFKPQDRPWIDVSAATTLELTSQVQQCPSRALQFYYNNSEGA